MRPQWVIIRYQQELRFYLLELIKVEWLIYPPVNCRKISNLRRTQSQKLDESYLGLHLSLSNPLRTGVKLRMKMKLEQRWQAMLQLHLRDQQLYCLLKCDLYSRFDGTCKWFQPNITNSYIHSILSYMHNVRLVLKLMIRRCSRNKKYSFGRHKDHHDPCIILSIL